MPLMIPQCHCLHHVSYEAVSIRVLVADDNLLVREGVRSLFSEQDDISVIGLSRPAAGGGRREGEGHRRVRAVLRNLAHQS